MNPVEKLLIEWAQDEFWVGHALAKKVYDYGPDLEENISVGSISQDEMGHCRLLLRCITQNDKEIDRFLFGHTPEQQRVSLLAESFHDNNWSNIVIKQFLYDYADEARSQFCRSIPDEKLQAGLDVIEREEQVHREHWVEWAKILAESPIGLGEMQKAVNELYPLLCDFFADPIYEEIVRHYSLAAEKAEQLLNRTLDFVDAILSELNLQIPFTRDQMKQGLERKGSRYGHHSQNFDQYFAEVTEVFRKYPDVVWS